MNKVEREALFREKFKVKTSFDAHLPKCDHLLVSEEVTGYFSGQKLRIWNCKSDCGLWAHDAQGFVWVSLSKDVLFW